jgi:hypothetical protein
VAGRSRAGYDFSYQTSLGLTRLSGLSGMQATGVSKKQEEVAGAREAFVPGCGIKYFGGFAEQSHFENEFLAMILRYSYGR